MQIAACIGAHETDCGYLIRGLQSYRAYTSSHSFEVPNPERYLRIIEHAKKRLNGQPSSRDSEEALLAMLLNSDSTERLVIGSENFLSWPQNILSDGVLLPNAGKNIRALRQLFPSYPFEFFLVVRNPFSFLHALSKNRRNTRLKGSLGEVNPTNLYWAPVVQQIINAVPDCRISVWNFSDLPALWPKIIKEISNLKAPPAVPLSDQIVEHILSPRGAKLFLSSLETAPPLNEELLYKRLSSYAFVHGNGDLTWDEADDESLVDVWKQAEENFLYDLQLIGELPNVSVNAIFTNL